MSSFLDVIAQVTKFSVNYDDDAFDRLSHRYTLAILVVSTVITGTQQYVGDPIDCWTPDHFSSQHVQYTDSLCWVSNTYYVGWHTSLEDIPANMPARQDRELSYYQWVPFILLSMAVLFYLPHIVWRVLNGRVGLNITGIVGAITTAEHLNPENRQKTTSYLVRHMDLYFVHNRERKSGLMAKLMFFCNKARGNKMIMSYLFVKILFIVNAICQLFLLNAFLRTDYNLYGFEVVSKIANGTDWKESRQFPRVTFCDIVIRRLGGLDNLHRYTLQCVLPVNLFSEKIFIFIWFWLVMVALLSVWGILPWFFTLFNRARFMYVKKYLKMADQLNTPQDKKLARIFIDDYLRQDGVFVLRLVSKNTNDIVIADLILGLWENFKKFRKDFHPSKISGENI